MSADCRYLGGAHPPGPRAARYPERTLSPHVRVDEVKGTSFPPDNNPNARSVPPQHAPGTALRRPALLRSPRNARTAVLASVAGLVSVGLLVSTAVLIYSSAERGLRSQAELRVRDTAKLGAQLVNDQTLRLSDLVETRANALRSLSDGPAERLSPKQSEVVRRELHALQASTLGVRAAAFTSPDGKLLLSDPPAPQFAGKSFASRDWYRGVTREHSPYVSRVFRAVDGPKTVTVAALVRSRRGHRVIGILSVGLQQRAQLLANVFASSQGTNLTVTDQAGSVIARAGAPFDALISLRDDPSVDAALRGRSGTMEHDGALIGYAPVPHTGGAVTVELPTSVAFHDVRSLRKILVLAVILLGAVLAGLTTGLVLLLRRGEARQRAEAGRLRALLESAPDATVVVDKAGEIVMANDQAERLFGYRSEELVGRSVEMLVPERLRGSHVGHRDNFFATPETRPMGAGRELFLRCKDGRELPVEISLSPLETEHGTLVSAAVRDITERKRIEDVNRRLAAIVEQTDDAVLVKTRDGTITEWNGGAERLYGYSADEAIGKPVSMLMTPERGAEHKDVLRRVFSGEVLEQYETERVRKDGERVHVSLTVSPIRDPDGTIVGAATIARDMSDRIRFEGQLRFLADHDSLTGLFNRRRFEEELGRELARARRYPAAGAVLAIDLDHFKYINDSLGHSAGDEVISATGEILRKRLRATDVLARLGGDEFAVILSGVDLPEAERVAASLLDAIRGELHVELPGGQRRVTASIGIAPFQDLEALTEDDLVVEADIAMYDAKEAGRDRARVYSSTEGRHERMQSRLTWADRIRRALEEESFVLHAQPILPLNGDTVPRHELLLRMVGDDGELIPPGLFLPPAERMDLIGDIDRWVLREAIRLLSEEQRAGHDIRLEVNISARSVSDPDVADVIERELEETGADGCGLCVEVTETAAIVNLERAKRFAAKLSELGCQFALDDFGAGFASFYYLKHLAFDYLKIDGEFVSGIANSHTDQLVVRSLVEIARGLGRRTIAEFVGDRESLELLREYGVDYAQGFYVGRPKPLAEVELGRLPVLGASAPEVPADLQ